MDKHNCNTIKNIHKHLSHEHYDIIQSEYNHYASSKTKEMPKTVFMKYLAKRVGTTLSNLYYIIADGTVVVMNSNLTTRVEFSAAAAINKRKRKTGSNNSKLENASTFINKVCDEFFDASNIASVDEIVNDLKLNRTQEISGLTTVCTKTIYNYIHAKKIRIKPIDCPVMSGLKPRKAKKQAKRQKGISIDHRPFEPEDRSDFGHWEGDLVVGSKLKNMGAILTLVERKTRNQIVYKLKDKTSKQVYMAINKLEKEYGNLFSHVFKSITFDNGNEFARYNDIETRPGSKTKRTSVYFAHPYASYERGSNEHGNKMLRYFIPKGANINLYSAGFIQDASSKINQKKRKIHNYKSSAELFNLEINTLKKALVLALKH